MSAPETILWQFERFALDIPADAVPACSHQGACDADVAHWAPKVARPDECTPDALRAELREYGAWDDAELADDAENWQRAVWIACGSIREEQVNPSSQS